MGGPSHPCRIGHGSGNKNPTQGKDTMQEPVSPSTHYESKRRRDHGFTPQPWARNAHVQSIFASLKLRALGTNEMVEASRELILDCANNVRLLGYYSPHPRGKALVLLLHGWEGSVDSTYILHSGRYFYRSNFDIFRLNLRDHGDTHHLNEGIFHGALLNEVVEATHRWPSSPPDGPFLLSAFPWEVTSPCVSPAAIEYARFQGSVI